MIRARKTIAACIAVGIAPFAGAQDDHGNTSAEATLLAIGASVPGELQGGSDTDVFRVDLVGLAEVEVRTSGQTDTMGEPAGQYGCASGVRRRRRTGRQQF